jgi:hypothetical protein
MRLRLGDPAKQVSPKDSGQVDMIRRMELVEALCEALGKMRGDGTL